ncbi:MAG: hypothetical protein ACOY15_09105 [Pseudomonadota bacterium]
MQNSIFVVNEEPYSLWEIDIRERNKEFLEGIDTEYFDYALKVHGEADDEKRASVALQTSLHHATEMLFLLLGAYIQAPDCAYAWIAKCSNTDLRELLYKIGIGDKTLFTKLLIERVTWNNIANCILSNYIPGSERNLKSAKLFADLWRILASGYADQNQIDEYNCIKHGFRVRTGGFSLAIGIEHEYGIAPPREEMKSIGSSKYGISYFKLESVLQKKGDRNIRSRKTSINWSIERTILLLRLVSNSINNVVSALKIANGAEAGTCKFLRPQEDEHFEKPWQYTPGITNMNMDFVLDKNLIPEITKQELLKIISDSNRTN